MATNYLEPGHLPDGVVLAHTLYGQPDTTVTHAYTAMSTAGTVQPAPDSGIPYYLDEPPETPETPPELPPAASDRSKRCKANDDTCNGWRIRDSELCAAHAGVFHR